MAVQGFRIDDFVANFEYTNISKASQFIIEVEFPSGIGNEIDPRQRKYMVTASSIPGTGIEPIEINWQGLLFPIASNRTFPEWSITFRMDSAGKLRKAYQQWFDMMHNPETNERSSPVNYMIPQQDVWNVNMNGEKADKIMLFHAFPTNIGEISLDYSSNEPETFDVTYRYLYSRYEAD